jgi:hypothetical protein
LGYKSLGSGWECALAESVELRLQPGTESFDPADELWLRQVRDLARELHRAGIALQSPAPEPGAKGAIDQIVISLGSAGAFTALVETVKSWLDRDRTRTLEVTYFKDGNLGSIKVSGKGDDVFTALERIKPRSES